MEGLRRRMERGGGRGCVLQGGRVFLMAPEPSAGLCSWPVIGQLPDTVSRPDKTQREGKKESEREREK